ncbi:MAG: 16S rRNA (cytosine(1402)-N(4))-methyltransferase RsmH [Phycisphaerales bacterium]
MDRDDAGHIPIMVEEILELLAPREGEVYVDLTLGRGGHAAAIGERLGRSGRVVGFDLDQANLEFSGRRLQPLAAEVALEHANFAAAPDWLRRNNLAADLVLADLGFASTQVDDPSRGLSFSQDGPLDMRLDPTATLTAETLVNESNADDLADLIRRYGEEPLARKIAARIVAERAERPIRTTARLARVAISAYGRRAHSSRMHPATRLFQALRIAVNDELGALESIWTELTRAIERAARPGADGNGEWARGSWIHPGARIAFISFHSLEDRIVKRAMADLARRGFVERLTRKPVTPGEKELARNPRSRSAKLRAIRVTRSAPPEA